jgi:protein gp37
VRGCSRVSPGCEHCYAERIAARFSGVKPGADRGFGQHEADEPDKFHGFAERTKAGPHWTGRVELIPEKLTEPLRWRKPRRVFVNSMSDLFHESLPDEAIDQVFAVMALCPQHTLQVLTKRAKRMREYATNPDTRRRVGILILDIAQKHSRYGTLPLCRRDDSPTQRYTIDGATGDRPVPDSEPDGPLVFEKPSFWAVWPLPNVHLGVSVESQKYADERIPELLATPAAVRWVSAEPLLEAVDLFEYVKSCDCCSRPPWDDCGYRHHGDLARLDWVVVGGESGPGARPMHPDWVRSIRDQCQAADVAFFFKQWGAWQPWKDITGSICGKETVEVSGTRMVRVGKKAAGAMLDGREWREYPR